MRSYFLSAITLFLFCGTQLTLLGQESIPSPEDFFVNYRKAFTPHHKLVDYFELVAANSDRVLLQQYGETYEGRPLMLAFVSSPSNIQRLEQLRVEHLSRSNIQDGQHPDSELAVVWLSYSVHGNEAAGSEASSTVLYHLASAKTGNNSIAGELNTYLENTIVILDPSLNPDGYTRYTDDQRRRATTFLQPNIYAWEHFEGWPAGRTNHYLFDLNRDWAWLTQKESQARIKIYKNWMPHIHADLHEMGANSSYYFAPAAEPYHEYITPFQRDFQGKIGKNHASIFDKKGWLYYTKEQFDLLYPSYGDTYPVFNGAIGMTYEQGGSGRAGRAYQRLEGDTITLSDRISHHIATSFSTIATASQNAAELNSSAADYFKRAQQNPQGKFESYIFPSEKNATGRLQRLTQLFDQHHITYKAAKKGGTAEGLGYTSAQTKSYSYNAGDLVVPARQVQGVLAQVLLDPVSSVPDSLTYDITAWSLPTVLGINGFATEANISLGKDFTLPYTQPQEDVPSYGFVVPIDAFQAWMAVAPELHRGMVARYSKEKTISGSTHIPAGSLFVLARDQTSSSAYAKTYANLLAKGLALNPLSSGFVTRGKDLGSDEVARIEAPVVALIQDDNISNYAFGHLWHMFEQRLNFPIRPLPWKATSAKALADVDVLLLPHGRLNISSTQKQALVDWVRNGGRLIALEGSAVQLAKLDEFGLQQKDKKSGLQTKPSKKDPMAPYANRERAQIADNIPGALIETQIDRTHPIGFGLGDAFYALRTSNRAWDFLDNGYNIIGIRENPTIRGFVGQNVRNQLEETLTLGVQPMGRGEVIYAADNLAYRGFWEHGMQVLSNAVFYR